MTDMESVLILWSSRRKAMCAGATLRQQAPDWTVRHLFRPRASAAVEHGQPYCRDALRGPFHAVAIMRWYIDAVAGLKEPRMVFMLEA